MEKILKETGEQRMHQLLSISEKEMSQINKQAHQIIKLKKKRAAQTTQNKEEFQRYSKLNIKTFILFSFCFINQCESN